MAQFVMYPRRVIDQPARPQQRPLHLLWWPPDDYIPALARPTLVPGVGRLPDSRQIGSVGGSVRGAAVTAVVIRVILLLGIQWPLGGRQAIQR